MQVEIMNYANKKKTVEIGNLEDILIATIQVISGDEVLTVRYKDGTKKIFDTDVRIQSFFDDEYDVYSPTVNLLTNEEWLNRKDSYDV